MNVLIMKKSNLFIVAILNILFVSCMLDDFGNDAEKVVGTYSVSSVDHVTWGGATGTLTNSGNLTIIRTYGNNIQTSGFFNTTGRVSGNTVCFDGFTSSNASGNIVYTFEPAYYSNNMMVFSIYGYGSLADNGTFYSFQVISNVTAIKN